MKYKYKSGFLSRKRGRAGSTIYILKTSRIFHWDVLPITLRRDIYLNLNIYLSKSHDDKFCEKIYSKKCEFYFVVNLSSSHACVSLDCKT